MIKLILILMAIALPSECQADAGTPLMWLGLSHLAIGNLIIGIIEGLVIATWFKAPRIRAIFAMIVANYFSAAVGALLIYFSDRAFSHVHIDAWVFYHLRVTMLCMFIATYFASILAEWPFCRLALPRNAQWKTALRASFVAQSASYALLAPLYFYASGASMASRLDFDPAGTFANANSGRIIFLDSNHETLSSMDFHGENLNVLKQLHAEEFISLALTKDHSSDQLEITIRSQNLNWKPHTESRTESVTLDELKNGSHLWANTARAAIAENSSKKYQGRMGLNYDSANDWQIDYVGSWAIEGVKFSKTKGGENLSFNLETPFFAWTVKYVTLIPHHQAVMQIGEQIALVDLDNKKIFRLAQGESPIVILK